MHSNAKLINYIGDIFYTVNICSEKCDELVKNCTQ